MQIRFLSFFLLILLVFASFASCKENADNGPKTSETNETAGTPGTETDTETAGADPAESETRMAVPDFDAYNYVLGTQAFSPNYQFTDRSPLSEISERIVDLGSNMIKFYATEDSMIDTLLAERPELKYVFVWYRSDPVWRLPAPPASTSSLRRSARTCR